VDRRLKPGTVLVREYQGERHTVTVVPGGYLWRETIYTSLSTVARAITGTTWNGHRFFGLKTERNRQQNVIRRHNEHAVGTADMSRSARLAAAISITAPR